MNITTNVLLIFVFIFLSLLVGIPGNDGNLIKNKLFLFVGIFIFQLVIESIHKLKYKCDDVDLRQLVNNAVLVSILCVVGYSIYIDFLNIKETRNHIIKYINNKNTHSFVIAFTISLFLFLTKIVEMVITGKRDRCEKI